MTMVERVAKAIGQHVHIIAGSCDIEAAARAAIDAMREPTESMFIAGVACTAANMSGQNIPFPKLWDHVIDAALT